MSVHSNATKARLRGAGEKHVSFGSATATRRPATASGKKHYSIPVRIFEPLSILHAALYQSLLSWNLPTVIYHFLAATPETPQHSLSQIFRIW